MNRTAILWIAPNLNHYKSRFLDQLAGRASLRLTVLTGQTIEKLGHKDLDCNISFERIDVSANRNNFALRFSVYKELIKQLAGHQFDVVLMPFERKFFPLVIFLRIVKLLFAYRFISYNHPLIPWKIESLKLHNRLLLQFYFSLYDRIVFYTEEGMKKVVGLGLIPKRKAFFANNTLDTDHIFRFSPFLVNYDREKTILFIGRLLSYRNLDLLFSYFDEMKRLIPHIRLVIIGDGPESGKVAKMADADSQITWRGSVIDEVKIAKDMRSSHVVFIPGHSGLSIVHAFCYGKPYMTLASYLRHPPEIDYLQDGVNGLLLRGDITADCRRIAAFLKDEHRYKKCCEAAYAKAISLSVENWCMRMEYALTTFDAVAKY